MAGWLKTVRVCIPFAIVLAPGVCTAAELFAGKQIRFIVGGGPGGGYDILARTVAPYLTRYIPGQPAVVVQNMPEAGSLAAANYLANLAPKDGTVIALLQRSMLLVKMTNPSAVRFDLSTLNWIGNLNSETSVVLAWNKAPVSRTADLFTTSFIVGGTVGADPETTALMYNGLLGTRFKIVNGYKGTTDIAHAMETGEVQGIADWSWSTLKVQKADWLRDKTVRVLMQAAATRDPDLPDIPNALEFAKDPTTRAALELYLSQKTVARPIAAPPGMPPETVKVLQQALLAAGNDAELRQAVALSGTELNILSGDAVVKVIKQIETAPDDVVQKLKAAITTR